MRIAPGIPPGTLSRGVVSMDLRLRGRRLQAAVAGTVFAVGLLGAWGIATNPAWAAGVVNGAHDLGLTAYRAAPFRRERLVPYPAVTVPDPNLPEGLHQIQKPGLTGAMWQSGIELYLAPPPGAHAATRTSGTGSGTQAAPAAGAAPRPTEVKVFSQQVVSSPREAVIAVGTSPDFVQTGGHFYHYSKVLVMRATAYDATWASNGPWTGQRSAIGLPLNYGIVAVDPHVIPLGSHVFVEGYGLSVAADTGSAIVGDRIDLFFWDTPADIAAFGIRTLRVYVLDDPRLPPVPVPAALRNAG